MKLLPIPGTQHSIHLEQFVPSSFQNPWAIVAFALISSTLIKGIFDYAGTYLVSYAGFGMITDLRDDMYNAILRRSAAFFQKHTTGTLLSTLINDLERVQFSMSSVLGEFLQQFFTLIFTVAAVVLLGGNWLGCCCCSCLRLFFRRARSAAEFAGPRAAVRTNSPKFRTSCTRPSPATAS